MADRFFTRSGVRLQKHSQRAGVFNWLLLPGVGQAFRSCLPGTVLVLAGAANYCLAKCHHEYEHLFADVTRVKLSQLLAALKCILWDERAECIISVLEYQRQQ